MEAIRKYNELAGQFGWLPVNISLSDGPRVIRDAAERAAGCFPKVAAELRKLIK